jgi:hypothetical protein
MRASVSELVGTATGAETLAGVLEATAVDEAMLVDCIGSLVEAEGGEAALWAVLGSERGGSSEVTTEALRVLTLKQDALMAPGSAVTRAPPNAAKAKGLMKSMVGARSTVSAAKEAAVAADSRGTVAAAKLASSALGMLGLMELDADSAEVRRARDVHVSCGRVDTCALHVIRALYTHTHTHTHTHTQ